MTSDIKLTNCWSENYKLPLCPNHYNPHAYLGYINQIDPTAVDVSEYFRFFSECIQSGIFYRFPDRTQGEASWDEVIGAGSLNPSAASILLLNFRPLWHRFIFLTPYLKACAFGPDCLTWFDKLLIKAYIRFSLSGNLEQGDYSGRLRNWMIITKTGVMRDWWNERMVGAGYTLKNTLAGEPKENPWLTENADFRWFK